MLATAWVGDSGLELKLFTSTAPAWPTLLGAERGERVDFCSAQSREDAGGGGDGEEERGVAEEGERVVGGHAVEKASEKFREGKGTE